MPTARASRTIAAPAAQVWSVISDPYHLPRWWPRVERVEDVADGAFTEVMRSRRGKVVRADFDVLKADEQSGTVVWRQRLEGTPFAGVLSQSETELRLAPSDSGGGEAAELTIELSQELAGRAAGGGTRRLPTPSLGDWMLRRAARRTIVEALTGLERISG
jgi:uncharacterized protein YndB with AHSA1/START domain